MVGSALGTGEESVAEARDDESRNVEGVGVCGVCSGAEASDGCGVAD